MSVQDLIIKDINDLATVEEKFLQVESDKSLTKETTSEKLIQLDSERSAIFTRLLDYSKKRTTCYHEVMGEIDSINAHVNDKEAYNRLREYVTKMKG